MTEIKAALSEAAQLIERLARVMRKGEHVSGLNPAQWEALRYLARCNRFSNTPGALTDYLSATKGTISQTVNTLERKGYIKKRQRQGDKRSVALQLTPAGRKTLNWDPWQRLGLYEHLLDPSLKPAVREGLNGFLEREVVRNGLKSFGACESCRFFQKNAGKGDGEGPHFCGRYEAALSEDESKQICLSHQRGEAA